MKPTTESLMLALQAGLATIAQLAERHDCEPEDLRKTMYGITARRLATREVIDGAITYRLTTAGTEWKPGTSGAALRAAMWRTSTGARA